GRPAPLTFEPGNRQAAFLRADHGDLRRARFDLISDTLEQDGALLTARPAEGQECLLSRLAGRIDILGCADGELPGRSMRRRRGEGLVAAAPGAGDQVLAMQAGFNGWGIAHSRFLAFRFRISADTPKVQGGHSVDRRTVLTSLP